MRRRRALFGFAALLLTASTLVSRLAAQNRGRAFVSPEVLTTSDITYPINSATSGLVVVAVSLDPAGRITQKDVLRDIPSLTAPVLQSIDSWTFRPARTYGISVASKITVNIVFNPADYRFGGAAAPELGKELKIISPDAAGFEPPTAIRPSWAEYPLDSLAQGGVVLDARISASGRVTRIAATTRIAALTTISITAARTWTFRPAAFHGRPIAANAVVGYVFRPPNIALPVAKP